MAWSQAAGFVLLLLALPVFSSTGPTGPALAWGVAAGVGAGSGVALLYRGLARGRMSVVAPITAVEAAAVPLLAGVALGERPGVLALAGIALALAAITLVSGASKGRSPSGSGSPDEAPVGPGPGVPAAPAEAWGGAAAGLPGGVPGDSPAGGAFRAGLGGALRRPGIPDALGAGLGFGLMFVLLERAGDAGLWPLVGMRVSSLTLLAGAALVLGRSLRVAEGAWPTVLLAGALDQAANVLYLLATQRGMLSLVAVLTSLYPASTVLLARLVLGERLARLQVAGLVCAAGGVGLIATG